MAKGKSTEASLAKQLISGTKKHFSKVSSLTFGGSTFSLAHVESSIQTFIDLRAAVDDAKAVTKARLAAEAAQAPALRTLVDAYVTFVKATYGNSPDVLADFGLRPNKARTPPTIDQMASAAAKRAATRAARHTMGSKQKKGVKGTITTIVSPTPSTAAKNPVAAASVHVPSGA